MSENGVVGSDEDKEVPAKYQLEYFHATSGTGTIPSATVRLRINGERVVQEAAWGVGPIDATYNAIRKAAGLLVTVEDYQSHSATRGQDAIGDVTVRLACDGNLATGRGASTDIIEAAAMAYIDGLNRLAAGVGGV